MSVFSGTIPLFFRTQRSVGEEETGQNYGAAKTIEGDAVEDRSPTSGSGSAEPAETHSLRT